MTQFSKLNNFIGWTVFCVALGTYVSTIEQTASFWDCGEFIACAFKLQVLHPPGAPFFLLIGRIFSLLAFGDLSKVAYWVNIVSVVSSAFTILFLFWTITLLARKLHGKTMKDLSTSDQILILASGITGALAYAVGLILVFRSRSGSIRNVFLFYCNNNLGSFQMGTDSRPGPTEPLAYLYCLSGRLVHWCPFA